VGNVAIVTSTAVSIFGQGKLLSRLLSANGIQNIVNMNIDMVSVLSYATRNKVSNVFYFYDPFVLPHSTFGLPRRNVVNYWTADGISVHPLQRSYVRDMCNSGINIANDEFSKANMEAIGCHIDEIIHHAIDWSQLHKHINDNIRYTFGVNSLYNHGGVKWWMDRKGFPALIAILHKLYRKGVRFNAWVNSTSDFLTYVASKYGVEIKDGKIYEIGGVGFIKPLRVVNSRFIGTNDRSVIKYTQTGTLDDIGEFYGAVRYYLANSYAEGFGLGPIEALATGRFSVMNALPPWVELTRVYGLYDCVKLIPIHAHKHHIWGVQWNLLDMDFHIPDFNIWLNVLEDLATNGVKYDPVKCSELVKPLDYNNTYSKFLKYIE
jgi:hypothetical protein